MGIRGSSDGEWTVDLSVYPLTLITKTSVRVPLPRPLFVDHWTLAQAVSEFYSWEHPLCMVDSAWRFVLEMCDSAPTTADLRAAMVYQISFAVQRTGALAGPWAHLADDDDFLWPYEKLRA